MEPATRHPVEKRTDRHFFPKAEFSSHADIYLLAFVGTVVSGGLYAVSLLLTLSMLERPGPYSNITWSNLLRGLACGGIASFMIGSMIAFTVGIFVFPIVGAIIASLRIKANPKTMVTFAGGATGLLPFLWLYTSESMPRVFGQPRVLWGMLAAIAAVFYGATASYVIVAGQKVKTCDDAMQFDLRQLMLGTVWAAIAAAILNFCGFDLEAIYESAICLIAGLTIAWLLIYGVSALRKLVTFSKREKHHDY